MNNSSFPPKIIILNNILPNKKLTVRQYVNSISPIKTEKKNCVIGTSKIGDDIFRNQFGDIGNNLKNNRKKNRLSRFSLT